MVSTAPRRLVKQVKARRKLSKSRLVTSSTCKQREQNSVEPSNLGNSLRKSNINWVFVPPYAPSQNGSSESMVKLFKSALSRVLEPVRRKPSLIELQTFFSDAVRIVNDRPLTTPSDQPNDLCPITPSSFFGQH